MTGTGGDWMFTTISELTGAKHPDGSVTVKMTVYDPGPGKVCVGSYSVLVELSSNVQRYSYPGVEVFSKSTSNPSHNTPGVATSMPTSNSPSSNLNTPKLQLKLSLVELHAPGVMGRSLLPPQPAHMA